MRLHLIIISYSVFKLLDCIDTTFSSAVTRVICICGRQLNDGIRKEGKADTVNMVLSFFSDMRIRL